jgi:pyruvate kinase
MAHASPWGCVQRRRTKIVCTLGPASRDVAVLRAMVRAGMDVARINFSHGTRPDHARQVEAVRAAAQAEGKPIAVLQDIQGPKVRVGELREPLTLTKGQVVRFAPASRCPPGHIPSTHEAIAQDARVGGTLLLDDGNLELLVKAIAGEVVEAEVVQGGLLKSNKGINLPGQPLSLDAISTKDFEDIRFGIKLEVDIVAASFVRDPHDVGRVKAMLAREELPIQVLAKVERAEALDNLDAILQASDGALVARGDLGVELPPEEVPVVQKDLIRRCNVLGIPVITATQMLESMITNPRPTRAEATDVANAVWDGTGAVMLSGETAVGAHPTKVVEVMDRIVRRAESAQAAQGPDAGTRALHRSTQPDAIAHAAVTTAEHLGAKAIIALTNSGGTARAVSKYRPAVPILGVTPLDRAVGQLALLWGVVPFKVPRFDTHEELVAASLEGARRHGLVEAGDTVVVTSGQPGISGTTDRLRVHVVP